MTSIGGLVAPLDESEDAALLLALGGEGGSVRAPIAPGLFQDVVVRSVRRVAFDEPVVVIGPGTLALDGERERVLLSGRRAILHVRRDGPWVLDVPRVLARAAREGWLHTGDAILVKAK